MHGVSVSLGGLPIEKLGNYIQVDLMALMKTA